MFARLDLGRSANSIKLSFETDSRNHGLVGWPSIRPLQRERADLNVFVKFRTGRNTRSNASAFAGGLEAGPGDIDERTTLDF
jgi:hypothetical protein